MIGNINQYVKMMDLSLKANERIEDPFKVAGEENKDMGGSYKSKVKKRSLGLSVALTKLETGKKLNYVDLEALRKEDPASYKKALAIIRERKAYERKLKQCRTKSEARALQLSKTCSLAGDAKNGATAAPPGEVCAGVGQDQAVGQDGGAACGGNGSFNGAIARMKPADDVFIEYTKTRAYKKLPVYGVKIKSVRA